MSIRYLQILLPFATLFNPYISQCQNPDEIDKLVERVLKSENKTILFDSISVYSDLFYSNPDSTLSILKQKEYSDSKSKSIIDLFQSICFDIKNEGDSSIFYLKSCLEKNPNNYNCNYGLGVCFYNQAVEIASPTDQDYHELRKKVAPYLHDSKVYLEKCIEINYCDSITLDVLSIIYYNLKDSTNFAKVKDRMVECGFN